MRRHSSYSKAAILSLLIAAVLCSIAACGAKPTSDDSTDTSAVETVGSQTDDSAAEDEALSEDDAAQEEHERVGAASVTKSLIGEKFYDQTITNDGAALDAVESVLDRIGGDETTKLELVYKRSTETGTTYYVFRQRVGEVPVHGASVKLVVNGNGEAVGLVSAIMPNIWLDELEQWAITQEEAEQVVRESCAEEGIGSVEVVEGATEQTVISLEDSAEGYRYAWVVYTNNYYSDVDAAYLSHYVSEAGDYLYAIPVSEPGNADSLSGEKAAFDFDTLEENIWTGTITEPDGTEKEVELPVLRDPETDDVYLADARRKILCADYAQFNNDDMLAPCMMEDDGFYNSDLLIYDRFIRVWDFYDSIGWTGPDDEGTPSLLLMNMVDSDGGPVENASYGGRKYGFQTFRFDSESGLGACLDVMAHEFAHCVTSTTMTTNQYLNDYGAINEGMSDILGNLTEMALSDSENGAWLMGEDSMLGTMRSLKNPHEYKQPEYAWDMYWGPPVTKATAANDCGGVHVNSSLLSLVSYKLNQAGMDTGGQISFWMNVALAMIPQTDYPQMAELLPWCMEQAGYAQYVDALEEAIEEGRYEKIGEPTKLPEGAGITQIDLDSALLEQSLNVRFVYHIADGGGDAEAIGWSDGASSVVSTVLPAGDYYLYACLYEGDKIVRQQVYTSDGWLELREGVSSGVGFITVGPGDIVQVPHYDLGFLDE